MTDITKTITLGGRTFPIAPLTLGQMRTVAPAFSHIGIDTPQGMGAQVTIIAAAMTAADPSVKVEDVDAIVGVTFDEIKVAVSAVATLVGLKPKVVPTSGEAQAPSAAPSESAPTVQA